MTIAGETIVPVGRPSDEMITGEIVFAPDESITRLVLCPDLLAHIKRTQPVMEVSPTLARYGSLVAYLVGGKELVPIYVSSRFPSAMREGEEMLVLEA